MPGHPEWFDRTAGRDQTFCTHLCMYVPLYMCACACMLLVISVVCDTWSYELYTLLFFFSEHMDKFCVPEREVIIIGAENHGLVRDGIKTIVFCTNY